MVIKIISLNLWWGGNLFPAIIDFLRTHDADIVALQEVHNGSGAGLKDRQRSMEVLRNALHYPYEDYAEAYILQDGEARIPMGNAVLSRYPIRSSSITFLVESTQETYLDVPEQWPIFPRPLQAVELITPAGAVNVFNMHGVWDLDGDSPSPARQIMGAKILQAVKDKPNVIVTGDTNATTSNPVLRDIERYLPSVFGDTLATTFNMRHKDNPGYASAAVDHMFISPGIKIVSRECPDDDISDHRPLVVKLEIS